MRRKGQDPELFLGYKRFKEAIRKLDNFALFVVSAEVLKILKDGKPQSSYAILYQGRILGPSSLRRAVEALLGLGYISEEHKPWKDGFATYYRITPKGLQLICFLERLIDVIDSSFVDIASSKLIFESLDWD